MLNAAVVGLGWWGRQIVDCLQQSDRIRVVKGVDVDPDAARGFADSKRLPLTGSYREVLDDRGIDAVILTTPHGAHEGQVLAAAAAGKQVFCEKPLALSAAAARRMIGACAARGIVLGIGHERRYETALEEMKRMLDGGELGRLLFLEFHASYNLFAAAPAAGWRQDPKQAPAGTMTALGVHLTDYIQTLAGPVKEVRARMAHRSGDYAEDDVLSVQFVFASGVLGSFTSIATTPFYQRMTVLGDRGWAEVREVANVDKPDPAQLIWRGMDEQIHQQSFKRIDTVTMNLHAWADAVAGHAPYRFSHRELLHNVAILEAIVQSVECGQTVTVEE